MYQYRFNTFSLPMKVPAHNSNLVAYYFILNEEKSTPQFFCNPEKFMLDVTSILFCSL